MGVLMWLTIEDVVICALWQHRLWASLNRVCFGFIFFNGVLGAARHPLTCLVRRPLHLPVSCPLPEMLQETAWKKHLYDV